MKSDGTAVLAPDKGDYTITSLDTAPQGNAALAIFAKSDANCQNVVANDHALGRSGIVTVDSLDLSSKGNLSGSFDITFGSSDKVSGSINATLCDVDPNTTGNSNCE
jgi:hypothetical protein